MYGVSKVFSFHTTVHYREVYGLFIAMVFYSIMNLPRRGPNFVTKKIVQGLVRIKMEFKKLTLGNLYAVRDWGHARLCKLNVEDNAIQAVDDWVIATNSTSTVKNFINLVAKKINIKLKWTGRGLNEKRLI